MLTHLLKVLKLLHRVDALYNKQAAFGDTPEKALRKIYKSVGMDADDTIIQTHLQRLRDNIGDGESATILSDLLADIEYQTLDHAVWTEVKNIRNQLITGKDISKKRIKIDNLYPVLEQTLKEMKDQADTGPGTIGTRTYDVPRVKVRALMEGVTTTIRDHQLRLKRAMRRIDEEVPPGSPLDDLEVITPETYKKVLDNELKDLVASNEDLQFFRDELDTQMGTLNLDELMEFWHNIYSKFRAQSGDTKALTHEHIFAITNAVEDDIKAWSSQKGGSQKDIADRKKVNDWVKKVIKKQDKITAAYNETIVETFKELNPKNFFDVFTGLSKNTIQNLLDMVGGKSGNPATIPVNQKTPPSQLTDKDIKAFLKKRGEGVRDRDLGLQTWLPEEKLHMLRTILVDQLLEKTYAKKPDRGTTESGQTQNAQIRFIHTLQDILDDIDKGDGGKSTGKGALIFGEEVWQNLRDMKPSKALFQWLSSTTSKGKGGLFKRMFGGLLVELLPFLRSTETGREFYRDVFTRKSKIDIDWSTLIKNMFKQGKTALFKKAPKTKLISRHVGQSLDRIQQNAEQQAQ